MNTKIVSLKDQVRTQFDTLLLFMQGKGQPNGWFRVTKDLAIQTKDNCIVRAVTVSGGRRRIILREFRKPIPSNHWCEGSVVQCIESWEHDSNILVPIGSSVDVITEFMNR